MVAKQHLAQRVRLLALAGGVALGVRCAGQAPPEQSLTGLAQMLSHASNTTVKASNIRWRPSPGHLREALFGRELVFLGASKPEGPKDVYRAHVRVTLDGKPISARNVKNITETPLGDDAGLEVRGPFAAFATVAFGSIQGVSLLELDGVRSADKPASLFHRLLQSITSLQRTGSLSGIGRTDIVLELPAQKAQLRLDPPLLTIDLGNASRGLVLDAQSRKLRATDGGQAYAARTVIHRQHEKPLILWGVDTVRREIGPAPIAWLEDKVFGAKDRVKRTTYAMFSGKSAKSTLKQETDMVAARVLDPSKLEAAKESWPPPKVPSLWKEEKPGEGVWKATELPFLRPMKTATAQRPPAYFYTTFIRPDKDRPYSEVMLIAMDMRQLELGMEAGFEDPKPLTGPPGNGRLPREKPVLDRVVATFNGAFKTTHGKYGMMVNRRVLLPPVPGGATVTVNQNGRVGLGSWPTSTAIPKEMVSFRQNLDPLVEDGVANPTGRYIWGWQLSGTSVMTQRTALCVTAAGHLYYAFGPEIDGPTLGKALRQAGCSYGMHLDMNPGHCGFVFTDIADLRAKEFNLKKAHPAMKMDPAKYVRWSAKDFFYVMVRDPISKPSSAGANLKWSADPGAQPPPAWLPGILQAKLKIGSLETEITSFEAGRVDFRIRAGRKEPSMAGGTKKKFEIAGKDAQRVVASVNLGHATEATRYGLAFDGLAALDLRSGYATLIVGSEQLRIEAPGTQPQLTKHESAVQLPLLAEKGELTELALTHGPMRTRGALCAAPGGRLLIAKARHDSDNPLVTALVRLGCKRVVRLDRGSQHPAFVHRATTPTPPLSGYETTVLYALGRPMVPHAFRWKAKGSTPSRKPTGFDIPPGQRPKKRRKK